MLFVIFYDDESIAPCHCAYARDCLSSSKHFPFGLTKMCLLPRSRPFNLEQLYRHTRGRKFPRDKSIHHWFT